MLENIGVPKDIAQEDACHIEHVISQETFDAIQNTMKKKKHSRVLFLEREKINMRPEILAPVGNREALEAAIAAGCDAVYFGLPVFGARAYAKNFSLEETEEIIKKCHLLNIKVYITMNTVIFEDEMEEAYVLAKRLHEMDVDALIIQDLGLLHLLHHRLPDLVLHASTQLSVSKPNMIEKLKQLGVQRVVLARECTMDEIRACVETGMEIEVFIHGAICICYSGQCYFQVFDMIAVAIVVCVLNHVECHILCIKIMHLWAESFII